MQPLSTLVRLCLIGLTMCSPINRPTSGQDTGNVKAVADEVPDRSTEAINESFEDQRARYATLVARFVTINSQAYEQRIQSSKTLPELREVLDELCLLSVSINPESRVKLDALKPRITVKAGCRIQFLLKIENTAGVTAPLQIEAYDMASADAGLAEFCECKILKSPQTSPQLSGALKEYKLFELIMGERGLFEVRFVGSAGQGTQDLGFRANSDILIEAR